MKKITLAAVAVLALQSATAFGSIPAKKLGKEFVNDIHFDAENGSEEVRSIGVVCPQNVFKGVIMVRNAAYGIGEANGALAAFSPANFPSASLELIVPEYPEHDELQPKSEWLSFKTTNGHIDFEVFTNGKVTMKARPYSGQAVTVSCKAASVDEIRGA